MIQTIRFGAYGQAWVSPRGTRDAVSTTTTALCHSARTTNRSVPIALNPTAGGSCAYTGVLRERLDAYPRQG